MLLNIVTGGIGSGKSAYLYRLIEENLKNNPGTNAVLIVPEQFSYTAEKTLVREMGGLGPNRVEVMTFSRLAHRFMPAPESTVLPSGKLMLAARAAAEIGDGNIFKPVAGRGGFINSCLELFSEFRRYGIMPEELDGLSPDNAQTAEKIASVNEIYKRYLSYFNENMHDSDNTLPMFAEKISADGIFSDTFFFIDDYNDFMYGHFEVIRALIRTSRGVHITLGIDESVDSELFSSIAKTKKRLIATALSEGAQLYTHTLTAPPEYIRAPEIRHLLQHWDEKTRYSGECKNIAVFKARDIYSEAEHTAAEIISLVRDRGMRFRDIGVICGNTEKYIHILSAVFNDFDIPFFTDEKLPVSHHPVAKMVLALFGIIGENWSYRSVFDYLRTGYIYEETENGVVSIEQNDVDLLENYVLRHGIRGKKAWFSEWTKKSETVFDDVIQNYRKDSTDLKKLNALREKIIAPFEKFLNNKGRTAHALASAVFGFMCDIHLYDGILYECARFNENGMRNEAELAKQVWNSVTETLDQAVLTLSGGSISRENFSEYFRLALSGCELSIIPSGLDRVSVGTVSRNSPARVKALFIIGANHGAIPAEPQGGSILSDADRCAVNSALAENEKEIAPDNAGRSTLEELKLYRVISTSEEFLSVSCAVSSSDGSAAAPSRFIDELIKMFPKMHSADNIISRPDETELLASAGHGFYYMLMHLSEYYHEKPSALWQSVYKWYAENPRYKDKLSILRTAAEYKRTQPKLSRMRAEALYGKNKKYSITQLEKFTSCPFSYYMECGLRARPREENRVEKSHIGSLIHAAIREFCMIVENGAETVTQIHDCWSALTKEKCNEIIDGVIDGMRDKITARAGGDDKRLEYLLMRCRRTLKKSAETIRKSLAAGGYTAVCYEKDFEVTIDMKNDSIILRGTIDRIDVIEDIAKNRLGIRIIDYKSGHKKFSVAAIASKVDMQLVLYAIAAVKLAKRGEIDKADSTLSPQVSAILYNRINDDMVRADAEDPKKALAEQAKQKKLDGLIILEDGELDGITPDSELLNEMDSGIAENKSSDFLNISFTSKALGKYSQLTSRSDFEVMEKYAVKTAIDTDKQIKRGKININPCKNGENSVCAYCKYAEACMFDAEFDSCRKVFSSTDAVMEYMKKEIETDEHE